MIDANQIKEQDVKNLTDSQMEDILRQRLKDLHDFLAKDPISLQVTLLTMGLAHVIAYVDSTKIKPMLSMCLNNLETRTIDLARERFFEMKKGKTND